MNLVGDEEGMKQVTVDDASWFGSVPWVYMLLVGWQ